MTTKDYNVRYIGDYFTMFVPVQTDQNVTDDEIIDLATNYIRDFYGWDIEKAANVEIEVI